MFLSVESWGRCGAGQHATAGYGAGFHAPARPDAAVDAPVGGFPRLSKRNSHYMSVASFAAGATPGATEWSSEVEVLLEAERKISSSLHG